MKDSIIIFHNSRCSKSRCTLDFLNERGLEYSVVEYLKDVPSKKALIGIIEKLGIKPEELVRKGEEEYKEHFKGQTLTDEQWIDAMLEFPKLIERPIVLKGDKAIIGRPTERIMDIL